MFPEGVNNSLGASYVGSTAEGHRLYSGDPNSARVWRLVLLIALEEFLRFAFR